MTTRDFVRKYNLDHSMNYSHQQLGNDMAAEFDQILATTFRKDNPHSFSNCVKIFRQKWDAVSNKTVGGGLPEVLWKYLYATKVAPERKKLEGEGIKTFETANA